MRIKATQQEIVNYLFTHVREIYRGFDGAHDQKHFDEVYNTAEEMCNYAGIQGDDKLCILIAAAYHDVGRIWSENQHEKKSAEMFKNDKYMKLWLTKEDIDFIARIISEHRGNSKTSSISSLILKDADKKSGIMFDRWLDRVVRYNVETYLDLGEDVIFYKIKEKLKSMTDKKRKSTWNSEIALALYGEKPKFGMPTDKEILTAMTEYIKELKKN